MWFGDFSCTNNNLNIQGKCVRFIPLYLMIVPISRRMSNLYGNVAWSVVQPAQQDPLADSCVPSEEAEAAYISNEFLNVWKKQGQSVISVPKTFPDPKNDGEKAEKALFEVLKEAGSNDPDLRLIIFNGLRSTGAADENSDLKLIREIDSAVFLEFNKTKKSASYMEVKCCKDESGLKSHRKKATNQLNKVQNL